MEKSSASTDLFEFSMHWNKCIIRSGYFLVQVLLAKEVAEEALHLKN